MSLFTIGVVTEDDEYFMKLQKVVQKFNVMLETPTKSTKSRKIFTEPNGQQIHIHRVIHCEDVERGYVIMRDTKIARQKRTLMTQNELNSFLCDQLKALWITNTLSSVCF